jgi:hypothetical protein
MSPSRGVDYSIFDGLLIHPFDAFTPATVKAQADKLGQPSAAPRIETFTWLLEVTAQLARELGPSFVLRGGTNVQLRLDPPSQRASQDVDAVFDGTIEELQAAMDRLNDRFGSCLGYLRFDRQQRDFPPAGFAAWTCSVPAAWGGQIYDGLPRRLLTIEISLLAGAELPTEALHGEVFGLRFAGPGIGLTKGALIGDKLLTLGPNTTGIRNAHDRIARQLYDLYHLTADGLGVAELRDAATTASYLAPLEAGHRGLDLQAPAALKDAIASAVAWGQLGLPSGPDKAVVREIRAWQGANVPLDKQLGAAGWATRALRVSMVADAVRVACEESPATAARRHRDQRALLQRGRPAQRVIAQQLIAHIGNGANALASGDPTRTCMLGLHHLGGQAVAELVRQPPDG